MDTEVEEPLTKAERMQYAMRKSGKTVAQIAGDIGVTPKAIYKWFSGGNLEDEQLIRFSIATGFNPRWLVFGDGPKRTKDNPLLDELERSGLSSAAKAKLLEQTLDFARFRIAHETRHGD